MPSEKISIIIHVIRSPEDKLKDIKLRLNDNSISYDEINIVLTNSKGKYQKRDISYLVEWYQKTNCYRKCYYNKNQRNECRIKFQKLVTKSLNLKFTKSEFLNFFNNHVKICKLSDIDKRKFVSWKEFKKRPKKC